MAYVSPAAQSSGGIAPVSWATSVKTALDYLANPPQCRVTKAALQIIATASLTPITFDTERYDTDTMHDTVTNNTRITFTTAGVYVVGGTVEWAADATSFRLMLIRLNGATIIADEIRPPVAGGVSTNMTISTNYKFAAADYIELLVQQNTVGNLNITKQANYSPEFYASWVGLG